MSIPGRLYLFVRCQQLQSILADCFQHEQPWLITCLLNALQLALVEQRCDLIQRHITECSGDGLYRLQGTTADKDGELPEKSLLTLIQQVVTPLERAA